MPDVRVVAQSNASQILIGIYLDHVKRYLLIFLCRMAASTFIPRLTIHVPIILFLSFISILADDDRGNYLLILRFFIPFFLNLII